MNLKSTSSRGRRKSQKGANILESALVLLTVLGMFLFIMDMGRIVRQGEGGQLLADPIIRDAYLGVLQS